MPEKAALSGGRTGAFAQKKAVKIYRHIITVSHTKTQR